MSTLNPSSASAVSAAPNGFLKAFAREASVLIQALLSPAKILGDMEQLRKLLVTANAVEATDPARAAALRARAAQIGRD